MRSENTPFVGGPLDGRVLPVLTGPTGHPPKWYRIPVPNDDDTPPTVHVYRRVPAGYTRRLGLLRAGRRRDRRDGRLAGLGRRGGGEVRRRDLRL
ncbi:hypothetical protein, partial [Streptomyces zhihengii]